MLSLDQVRSLETRVEKALAYIDELTEENAALRKRLGGYESRIKDLEVLVSDFQQDQGRIEEGILSALEKLNAFQDSGAQAASEASGEPKRAAKRSTEAPKGEAAVEIDETDEIIEEVQEGESSLDPAKPSGELDIF